MKIVAKILIILIVSGESLLASENGIRAGIVYEYKEHLHIDNPAIVETLTTKGELKSDQHSPQFNCLCFYELRNSTRSNKVVSSTVTSTPTGDGGYHGESAVLVLDSPHAKSGETLSPLGVLVAGIDCHLDARTECIFSEAELGRMINLEGESVDSHIEKVIQLAETSVGMNFEREGQEVRLEIRSIHDMKKFIFMTPTTRESNLVVAQTEPDSDLEGSEADFWIVEIESESMQLLLVRRVTSTLWRFDLEARELQLLEYFYKGP